LTNQLRRAALSVSSNIAEGIDRKSDKEFIRFLRISLSSLSEVVSQLFTASDLKLVNRKEFDILYTLANNLAARINALINKLKQ